MFYLQEEPALENKVDPVIGEWVLNDNIVLRDQPLPEAATSSQFPEM